MPKCTLQVSAKALCQDMLGDLLQGSERLTVGHNRPRSWPHNRARGRCKVDGTASGGPSEARAQRMDFCLSLALPASVVSGLFKRNLTITTVESCTCGQVLALVGGDSRCLGGIARGGRGLSQRGEVPAFWRA